MRTVIFFVSLVLLSSCATGGGTDSNPIQTACSQKAKDASAELVTIAAKSHVSPADITDQFQSACESQLQHDLDQVLTDLQNIAAGDAGTQSFTVRDGSKP